MSRSRMSACIASLVAVIVAGYVTKASAQTFDIIAQPGLAAPDGNGSFYQFAFWVPMITNSGQVAFHASCTNPAPAGIFRAAGDPFNFYRIGRLGEAPPDGAGTFSSISPIIINEDGQGAFRAVLQNTTQNEGIFRRDANGTLVEIARKGQAPPDGGLFYQFEEPVMNSAGQVAFLAITLNGGAQWGFYRGDGAETTLMVKTGDEAPGGGTFNTLSTPLLRSDGQLIFNSILNVITNSGVFKSDGATIEKIVRNGDPAPDGGTFLGGQFNGPFAYAVNNQNQLAIIGYTTIGGGLYLHHGETIHQIVATGDPAPSGTGNIWGVGYPSLNNSGQMAFSAFLANTTEPTGIFRADMNSLVQIARVNDPTPSGNGHFAEFYGHPLINDSGQVAFLARLMGTQGGTNDDVGAFFYDDSLGLIEVAREGQPFFGGSLSNIQFVDINKQTPSPIDSLNNAGQIVFAFEGGSMGTGIAIWNPPPIAQIPGDITGDGVVNVADLLAVIQSWGPCPAKGDCPADIAPAPDGDGMVNVADLLMVISNWG